MDNNYGNMNDTNNTNSTNNNTNNVNFTMSGNPYNPDEQQKAAQTNNTSAESYSQSYNPYSQASVAGQPNANQSYAYQQTVKPKKQRAPRKPGAFGPFAAKTVAAALIFGQLVPILYKFH